MTPAQLTLDEAMAEGQTAIGQADDNADQAWRDRAWDALVRWLTDHDSWFCDDWWDQSGIDEPREGRALGALVQRAARQGLMVKTGEWRPSRRSHGTSKPCWRSTICEHSR